MSSGEKNIDRIFRDKLRNFDAEPPVEVWGSIKERLFLDRRRKMTLWITRVAAGIAVLAVLSVSYFIARNTIKERLISEDETKVETGTEESTPLAEEVLSEKESPKTIYSEEEFLIKESSETQSSQGEFIAEESSENQYSEGVNRQEITDELKSADRQNMKDELVLTFVHAKSIGQVEYKSAGIETKPVWSGKQDLFHREDINIEEFADDEIYALNVPEEDEKLENRWAIGTQVSPLYSYRSLSTQNEAMALDESMALANNFNQAESGTLAYAGGVNVNYSPIRRLSIQSGVYYSRYGVSVDNAYLFDFTATADVESSTKFYSINNSSGIIDIENNPSMDYVTNKGDRNNPTTSSGSINEFSLQVNSGEVIQNFEYIEVPLILRYRLVDRKVGFNFLGGMSTNMLVGSNTYYNNDGNREKIGETTDLKPFNYSSIVGIGIDYAISDRFNISLEPTFRYYLNSINESSVIRSYPYSIGIFTGLRYYF